MAEATVQHDFWKWQASLPCPKSGLFSEVRFSIYSKYCKAKIEQRAVIMSLSKYCFAHDPASSDGPTLLYMSRSNILLGLKILCKQTDLRPLGRRLNWATENNVYRVLIPVE